MSTNEEIAVVGTILAKKASRRRNLIFYGGVVLFIVISVVIFIIIRRRRAMSVVKPIIRPVISKEEKITQLSEKKDEIRSRVAKAGEQFGMTEKDIETIIPKKGSKAPIGADPNLKCAVYPMAGKCDDRFYDLKNGCCELRDNSEAAAKAAQTRAMKSLALEVGVGIVAEEILTNLLPKIIKGEIGGKLATKLKMFVDDGAKMGAKFAPMMARLVGKVARSMAFKLLMKGAMVVMKLLAKLGSGPVGWAMMVLDVMTIVAGIGDQSGYNSFIENKMFIDMRNQIVYSMWEAVRKEGNDLPVVFPVSNLYKEEFDTAQSAMFSEMLNEVAAELVKTDSGKQVVIKLLARAADEENGDTPGPDTEFTDEEEELLGNSLTTVRNKDPLEYDKKLLENIRINLDPEKQKDVVLVPSMSSEKSIGISISKEAGEKWNNDHKQDWFDNNDLFFPPNKPEEYTEPFAAVYTKKYLTIDESNPGTRDNPTIIFKELPEEVTLMYPFGMLVSNCEKPRSATKYGTPIDPREYGVNFNYSTGVCDFTKDYCTRYGMERKKKDWGQTNYVDCVKKPGQAVAEAVLGPDMTRASIRVWEDRQAGLKSGDPAKVAESLALIVVDPTGLSQGSTTTAINNFNRRQDEYSPAEAAALTLVDPLGLGENFGKNMAEQLAGRDKYCVSGDTCKRFHAKHNGGNFMNWSVRGADGSIYSNGQGYQNQVKDTEDHVFFIPTDGYFKVSCQPGEKRNFSYDEITDPFKVSCAAGKIRINQSRADQAVDAVVTIANETADFAVDAANATADVAATAADFTVDAANTAADFVSGVVEDPEAAAKAAAAEAEAAAREAEKAAAVAASGAVNLANKGAEGAKDLANKGVSVAESGGNEVVKFFSGL